MVVEAADLDLSTVRAFVAVSEERYFSEAAVRLGLSQQAVSKRIAKLESDLGVRLFFRTRSGASLTGPGRTFLHHARALVGIADQALEALRGRRRTLRIDVLDTRLASIDLVRTFHRSADGVDIDIVTSTGLRSARAALGRGSVDAAFARVSGSLEEELFSLPALLEPAHLIVSRDHPFARGRGRGGAGGQRQEVRMDRLTGRTVWMPGNTAGSEWADYFEQVAAAFSLQIDTTGPDFGWDFFVEEIAAGDRIGIVGEQCRLPWNPRTVQLPIVDPVPVYPWSLLCHRQNHHPALSRLTAFVAREFRPFDPRSQWLPAPDRPAFSKPGAPG